MTYEPRFANAFEKEPGQVGVPLRGDRAVQCDADTVEATCVAQLFSQDRVDMVHRVGRPATCRDGGCDQERDDLDVLGTEHFHESRHLVGTGGT